MPQPPTLRGERIFPLRPSPPYWVEDGGTILGIVPGLESLSSTWAYRLSAGAIKDLEALPERKREVATSRLFLSSFTPPTDTLEGRTPPEIWKPDTRWRRLDNGGTVLRRGIFEVCVVPQIRGGSSSPSEQDAAWIALLLSPALGAHPGGDLAGASVTALREEPLPLAQKQKQVEAILSSMLSDPLGLAMRMDEAAGVSRKRRRVQAVDVVFLPFYALTWSFMQGSRAMRPSPGELSAVPRHGDFALRVGPSWLEIQDYPLRRSARTLASYGHHCATLHATCRTCVERALQSGRREDLMHLGGKMTYHAHEARCQACGQPWWSVEDTLGMPLAQLYADATVGRMCPHCQTYGPSTPIPTTCNEPGCGGTTGYLPSEVVTQLHHLGGWEWEFGIYVAEGARQAHLSSPILAVYPRSAPWESLPREVPCVGKPWSRWGWDVGELDYYLTLRADPQQQLLGEKFFNLADDAAMMFEE